MNGILLFNKPILWTSHDAVDFIRRRIHQRAVGHAGTLDPMASGLLLILLGEATKLFGTLSHLEKEYHGTMRLGLSTDTQDLDGRILSEMPLETVQPERLRQIFLEFNGAQFQTPPAYSAVKKGGRKLYEMARLGIKVEVAPKEIFISRFDLLNVFFPEVHFSMVCSKGTYVRSICDSVGKKLGCGAVLSALVRNRVGSYELRDALTEETVRTLSFPEIEKRLLDDRLSRS